MKNTRKARFIRFVIVGIVLYTILVSQITLAMVKPEVVEVEVIKYIEVEVEKEIEDIEEKSVVWLRDVPLSEELQKYTYELCEKHEISYDLFLSIMKAESNFNPSAINKNTNGTFDAGLMQINSVNTQFVNDLAGKELDLYNAKDNILASVLMFDYFREYWIRNGVTDQESLFGKTLLSYNRGQGGARTFIANRGTYRSSYVNKIFNYKTQLEMNGGF